MYIKHIMYIEPFDLDQKYDIEWKYLLCSIFEHTAFLLCGADFSFVSCLFVFVLFGITITLKVGCSSLFNSNLIPEKKNNN